MDSGSSNDAPSRSGTPQAPSRSPQQQQQQQLPTSQQHLQHQPGVGVVSVVSPAAASPQLQLPHSAGSSSSSSSTTSPMGTAGMPGLSLGTSSGASLLHSQLVERMVMHGSLHSPCPSPNSRGSSMSSQSPAPSSSPPALTSVPGAMTGAGSTTVSATVTAATLAAAAAAAAAAMHGKSTAVTSLLLGADLALHGHVHAGLHQSGGHHHQGHHGHHHHHHHGGSHSLQQHQHVQDRGGPYGSNSPLPPTVPSSDPTANECKLIDYRGAQVAAFVVSGETMLCLPQAFEMFLKHLVGGLHTVYTKLKRLDITPIVCNVEQVRILRGLGAIQPGVNRCKLLSCKDFDVLYKDCTTARRCESTQFDPKMSSSRPGRPPKRASLMGMSAASQDTLLKLKKSRLENGEYANYENGHIAAHLLKGLQGSIDPMMLFPLITGELRMSDKSPLLANGYNHPPSHINPMPFMALNHHHHHHGGGGGGHAHSATTHSHGHLSSSVGGQPMSSTHHTGSNRSDGSIIIKERAHAADQLQARLKEEKADCDRQHMNLDHRVRDLSQYNGSSNGHSPVLNLSQKNLTAGEHSGSEAALNDVNDDDDDNISDVDDDDDKDPELSDCPDVTSTANGDRSGLQQHAISYSALLGENSAGISSIETLLRNIQGLLKVAADNARQQERQINYEKAELKMEILREREVRENIEKQLIEDQRTRVLHQKRLKRERRARRRLQEQLEQEMKRRIQYEEALKSTSSETLRMLNDSLSQHLDVDRTGRADADGKMQQGKYTRVYYKNSALFSSAT